MNLSQVLKNCRAAENRHAQCKTDESRRKAAVNVLHWTHEWLRRRNAHMPMTIRVDGYIDCGTLAVAG